MIFGIKGYGVFSPVLYIHKDVAQLISCRRTHGVYSGCISKYITIREFIDRLPIKLVGDESYYENDMYFNRLSKSNEGLLINTRKGVIEFGKLNLLKSPDSEDIESEYMGDILNCTIRDYMDVYGFTNGMKVLRYGKRRKLIGIGKELIYTSGVLPDMDVKMAKESDTIKLFNKLEKRYLNPDKVEYLSGNYGDGITIKIEKNPIALTLAPVQYLNKNYMKMYTVDTDRYPLPRSRAKWVTAESHFNKLREYYLKQSL